MGSRFSFFLMEKLSYFLIAFLPFGGVFKALFLVVDEQNIEVNSRI